MQITYKTWFISISSTFSFLYKIRFVYFAEVITFYHLKIEKIVAMLCFFILKWDLLLLTKKGTFIMGILCVPAKALYVSACAILDGHPCWHTFLCVAICSLRLRISEWGRQEILEADFFIVSAPMSLPFTTQVVTFIFSFF